MKIKKNILILSVVVLAAVTLLVFCLRKGCLGLKEVPKAKVAIVLDDWGYNLYCVKLLKEMDIPLTISILPNLRYSRKIARIANGLNQEVILHLPLEPEKRGRKIGLEKDTITSRMSDEEISKITRRALDSVPYAKGVSNHMGSRATKDKRIMSLIFAELKEKGLFFLDNLVMDKSVCQQLAQELKLKFASRDVFLDNLDDKEYIRGQVRELSEFAKTAGQAVGIGHAKSKTLEVLKEEAAIMGREGIEFVFISELIK